MKQIKKFILYGFFMCGPIFGSWSQSLVSLDNNWILDSNRSDEFNYLTRNDLKPKWNIYDNKPVGYSTIFRDDDTNVFFSNNISPNKDLILRVKDSPTYTFNGNSYTYTSGQLGSPNPFNYGYFEVRAKLPKGKGIWLAFWLNSGHHDTDTINHTGGWGNDLNFFEPYGAIMHNAMTHSSNLAASNNANCNDGQYPSYPLDVQSAINNGNYTEFTVKSFPGTFPDLSAGYHVYGCEWLAGRIILYLDYQVVREINYSVPDVPPNSQGGTCSGDVVPSHPMYLYLDIKIDNAILNQNIAYPTFPLDLKIDWFHYYTLNTANIGTDRTLLTSSSLSSYNEGIRHNITIGNSSSNISLTSGQRVTLRATNNISINGQFSVNQGASFSAIPYTLYGTPNQIP